MKARKGNMALINSRILREGDNLGDGTSVVTISSGEVILDVKGKRYRMTYSP
jgi:hypothetical protein